MGRFVVIDREEDVGGTWWSNTYPGCQCDIPSNLYSFSFAPNPEWDRLYPMRDQIYEYLRDCADRFGVRPHVRLGSELLGARWVADGQHWELDTSDRAGRRTPARGGARPAERAVPRPRLPGPRRLPAATPSTPANWDHYRPTWKASASRWSARAPATVQVVPESSRLSAGSTCSSGRRRG